MGGLQEGGATRYPEMLLATAGSCAASTFPTPRVVRGARIRAPGPGSAGGTAPLARAKGSGKGVTRQPRLPGADLTAQQPPRTTRAHLATRPAHLSRAARASRGAPGCPGTAAPRDRNPGIARSGETAHLARRRAAALAARGCHTWRAPTEPRCPRTPDSASCPPRTPKGLPLVHDPSQPRCPAPAATVVTPGGKRTGCLSRAKGTPKVDPDRGRPITPSTRLQREHPPD